MPSGQPRRRTFPWLFFGIIAWSVMTQGEILVIAPGWNLISVGKELDGVTPEELSAVYPQLIPTAWGWSNQAYQKKTSLDHREGVWIFSAAAADVAIDLKLFDKNTLYIVIDLTAGPDATSYPVTYQDTLPDPVPPEYKATKLVLRRIPAGTFSMGSPTDELGRFSGYEQQHDVTLTQDFYIGVFEVTQKQWERVMNVWPSHFYNTTVRDVRPVERVSYDDIRGATAGAAWPADSNVDPTSFVGRLRARTGLALDLPTEAQWEYACRAGTTAALNNGTNLSATGQDANMNQLGRNWFNGGSGATQNGGLSVGTAAVGSYLPNAWGLYDMHGNVWEWCLDWWITDHPDTPVTDPVGPETATGSKRTRRGGGWSLSAQHSRSASRYEERLTNAGNYMGFRLAKTVP